jgi:cytochrome c oxidase subunit 3
MDGLSPARNERAAQTLLLAFLATVVMLFAGFTSAWLIRRTGSDWGRLELPWLAYANTAALALSSLTLELARPRRTPAWFAALGCECLGPTACTVQGTARRALTATLALGLLFLAGQVALWLALSKSGAFVTSTPQGAFLFLLSAVHGLHLLGGLAALGWLLHRRAAPRLAAVYWHFLGLTWLYVLCLLHLR